MSEDTSFIGLLKNKWDEGKFVCVGLDSDYSALPNDSKKSESIEDNLVVFNLAIVDATANLVNSYKINSAFYESLGPEGWSALIKTVKYIKTTYKGILVILDAKRADIGSTNLGYIKMAFDGVGVEAITVHPYLGMDALQPFLDLKDKGILVLARTSNPGSGEFQDLEFKGKALYEIVAEHVAKKWNKNNNCGLVVGGTFPEDLKKVREAAPNLPILVPGIGAQGGDLKGVLKNGLDKNKQGLIINSSRGIIFASSKGDFADRAREETEKLHKQIQEIIKNV